VPDQRGKCQACYVFKRTEPCTHLVVIEDKPFVPYPRIWLCTRCTKVLRTVVGDAFTAPAITWQICNVDSNALRNQAR